MIALHKNEIQHFPREVHMSDLIRAHEGNGDTNDAYPSKIHWAKFNMMGRFITSTLQCQAQCRNSNDYNFPERRGVAELFVKLPVMSTEVCTCLNFLYPC
jgi:hypothetical protein